MSFASNPNTGPDPDAKTPHPVIVVGMGPAGLAAAFYAAEGGYNVLLIEKRTEEEASLRPQMVVLAPGGKRQLLDMIGGDDTLDESDIKFLEYLLSSTKVKLSAVQKFVLRRIKHLNKVNDEKENNVKVRLMYEYELEPDSVDSQNGTVKIKSPTGSENYSFSHLVAADGAKSQTLKRLEEEQNIPRSTPPGMDHIEGGRHLSGYVKLSRADGKELELPRREFTSSFLDGHLYFLQFDKRSHEKSGKSSVKLGFVGEVPKGVHDKIKTNPKTALDYVKQAAANYLGVKTEELRVDVMASQKPKKERLKILPFLSESKKAERAAFAVNGRGFYLLGDAYFTPNYAIGHGLNNGVEAARLMNQLFSSVAKNQLENHIERYNQLTENNANEAINRMRMIRQLREFGINMPISNYLEWAVEAREQEDKINLSRYLNADAQIIRCIENFFNNKNEDNFDQVKEISRLEKLLENPHITRKYFGYIYGKVNQLQKEEKSLSNDKDFNRLVKKMEKYAEEIKKSVMATEPKKLNEVDSFGVLPIKYAQWLHFSHEELEQLFEKGANPFLGGWDSVISKSCRIDIMLTASDDFVDFDIDLKFTLACLIACRPGGFLRDVITTPASLASLEWVCNILDYLNRILVLDEAAMKKMLAKVGVDMEYLKNVSQAIGLDTSGSDANKVECFRNILIALENNMMLAFAKIELQELSAMSRSITEPTGIQNILGAISDPELSPEQMREKVKKIIATRLEENQKRDGRIQRFYDKLPDALDKLSRFGQDVTISKIARAIISVKSDSIGWYEEELTAQKMNDESSKLTDNKGISNFPKPRGLAQ
ncbi:MAG: FAD-dependent oxidoreductase [Gammaproteobacteria bacterium]|nr:FAD-dependent oxidoreductase [Gammaproteobacteria bacterium]MCW5584049.1 FAD-dependent oxidoreductase [Gammaproteobacteria bacterium]